MLSLAPGVKSVSFHGKGMVKRTFPTAAFLEPAATGVAVKEPGTGMGRIGNGLAIFSATTGTGADTVVASATTATGTCSAGCTTVTVGGGADGAASAVASATVVNPVACMTGVWRRVCGL